MKIFKNISLLTCVWTYCYLYSVHFQFYSTIPGDVESLLGTQELSSLLIKALEESVRYWAYTLFGCLALFNYKNLFAYVILLFSLMRILDPAYGIAQWNSNQDSSTLSIYILMTIISVILLITIHIHKRTTIEFSKRHLPNILFATMSFPILIVFLILHSPLNQILLTATFLALCYTATIKSNAQKWIQSIAIFILLVNQIKFSIPTISQVKPDTAFVLFGCIPFGIAALIWNLAELRHAPHAIR